MKIKLLVYKTISIFVKQIKSNTIMKTTTLTTPVSKDQALNDYAALLLANGFTIIAPEKISTYFHFSKDNKIGYVQKHYYEGYTFSTVHKPCKEVGTGFRFSEPDFDSLTLENAINCINCYAPEWAKVSDRNAVKKYESLDAFIHAKPFDHVNDIILTPKSL